MKSKSCSRCKLEKSLDEFYFHKARSKHTSYCKMCYSATHKENYEKRRAPELVKNCIICSTQFKTRHPHNTLCGNKECLRINSNNYNRKRPNYYKTEPGKKYRRNRSRSNRLLALSILGGKCKCGFDDIRALHIDHVFGQGNKERREGITNSVLVDMIVKGTADLSKYQVLCANCNWIKRIENREGNYSDDLIEFYKERYNEK